MRGVGRSDKLPHSPDTISVGISTGLVVGVVEAAFVLRADGVAVGIVAPPAKGLIGTAGGEAVVAMGKEEEALLTVDELELWSMG